MSVYGRGASGWTPPPRGASAKQREQEMADLRARTEDALRYASGLAGTDKVIDLTLIDGVWQVPERKR